MAAAYSNDRAHMDNQEIEFEAVDPKSKSPNKDHDRVPMGTLRRRQSRRPLPAFHDQPVSFDP